MDDFGVYQELAELAEVAAAPATASRKWRILSVMGATKKFLFDASFVPVSSLLSLRATVTVLNRSTPLSPT